MNPPACRAVASNPASAARRPAGVEVNGAAWIDGNSSPSPTPVTASDARAAAGTDVAMAAWKAAIPTPATAKPRRTIAG